MKYFLTLIAIAYSAIAFTQTDTSKIYNARTLKKGFYKTYDDYINNSPAFNYDFTVDYNYLSKSDSTIISADYTIVSDSLRTGKVWGFCDGKNIFIRKSSGLLNGKFWRIEYIGKLPYYNYSEKHYGGYGPGLFRLATAAAELATPRQYDIMLRDENDKNYIISKRIMRKLLIEHKELLDEFNKKVEEIKNDNNAHNSHTEEIKIFKEYLKKLNDKLIH